MCSLDVGGSEDVETVGGRTLTGLITTLAKNTGIPEAELVRMPYRTVRLRNIDQVNIDTRPEDERGPKKVEMTGEEAYRELYNKNLT